MPELYDSWCGLRFPYFALEEHVECCRECQEARDAEKTEINIKYINRNKRLAAEKSLRFGYTAQRVALDYGLTLPVVAELARRLR